MEKRKPSHTNYRHRPTPSIAEALWESLLVFSTPARVLILGLLCASWTFRALPTVLAQNPAVTDRSSTFQVLADGTQDLAALIGPFATDSVERYSVDYSRGYLSVAVATCSLLGILGYVRALVKLAMGSKACQDSAFPTAPVRAILGVAEADRLPREDLVEISYVSRTTRLGVVRFEMVKRLRHTQESLPISIMSFRLSSNPGAYGRALALNGGNGIRDDRTKLLIIFGSLLLTAAATSFPILPVSSIWSWSRVLASFGLFGALAISSVMWAHVYIKEQTPSSLYERSIFNGQPDAMMELNKFAIMHTAQGDDGPVFCNLHAISGYYEMACRAISLIAGAVIAVGYICQYVEVRRTTTNQAAIWLGVQTALAFIRALIWMLDPKFDDYIDDKELTVPEMSLSFNGHGFAYAMFCTPLYSPMEQRWVPKVARYTLELPVLLSQRLRQMDMLEMLEQAHTIAASNDVTELRNALVNECTAVWDFPPKVFGKWLAYKRADTDSVRNPPTWYSCKIINLRGTQPWVGGDLVLLPVILVETDVIIPGSTQQNTTYRTAFRTQDDWLFRKDHTDSWQAKKAAAPVSFNPHFRLPEARDPAEFLEQLSKAIEKLRDLKAQGALPPKTFPASSNTARGPPGGAKSPPAKASSVKSPSVHSQTSIVASSRQDDDAITGVSNVTATPPLK